MNNYYKALLAYCKSDELDKIMKLIEFTNSINEPLDLNGEKLKKEFYSPLITAVYYNNINIVKYLIEICNVDINLTYKFDSALHTACYNANLEMVEYLIRNKANVNIKEINGNTPLFSAINNKINFEHLREFENRYEITFQMVKCLVENGANINHINKYNRVPLHEAISKKDIGLIKYLLDNGSDVSLLYVESTNIMYYIGLDILETLINFGKLDLNIVFNEKNIIKYLFKYTFLNEDRMDDSLKFLKLILNNMTYNDKFTHELLGYAYEKNIKNIIEFIKEYIQSNSKNDI